MKRKLLYLLLIIFTTIPTLSQRWENVEIPEPFDSNYWLDVYFHPDNPNYGWICGFNGMTLRTTNGGDFWQGSFISGAHHLESIHFPSTQVGYASGPAGIYKSIDGGASWQNVSPALADSVWGCYFLTEEYGVVVGGGCINSQNFWLTDDGGNSWTVFTEDVPQTGLTDALLFDSGLGFASSSGHIWLTTDMGTTWEILHDTGTNVWQEEITYNNGGFLVPTAGINCNGAGNAGGFRYYDTRFDRWGERNLNTPMFGAFMMDEQSGWIVGNNRTVVYADNYFSDAELRNCGIGSGSLDDIWMINDEIGWVVGDGVYKLSEALLSTEADSLVWDEVCINNPSIKEIYIQNESFTSSTIKYSILGLHPDNFELLDVQEQETLGECDGKILRVRFESDDTDLKQATLLIIFNEGLDSESFVEVDLRGQAINSDAEPNTYELIFNPAFCNVENSESIRWTSNEGSNSIIDVSYLNEPNIFNRNFALPLNIPSSFVETEFTVTPLDTGWFENTVNIITEPCDLVHELQFRAYGVSPIINAPEITIFNLVCGGVLKDTIPVFNTGNDVLKIDNYDISDPENSFRFVEWIAQNQLPIEIEPGDTAYIVVQYENENIGSNVGTITFTNNDSTKTRGDKNPYMISIRGVSEKTDFSISPSRIDYGKMCLGDFKIQELQLRNTGNIEGFVKDIRAKSYYTLVGLSINEGISPDAVRNIELEFSPTEARAYLDTLEIEFKDCEEVVSVIIEAEVEELILEADRTEIVASFQSGQTHNERINISSNSIGDVRVTDYYFNPPLNGYDFTLSSDLFVYLLPDQGVTFDLEFYTDGFNSYDGEICFIAEGECDGEICIPLNLSSIDRMVKVDPERVDFGVFQCDVGEPLSIISISNVGLGIDSVKVVDFIDDENAFTFTGEYKTYELNQSGALELEVIFNPPTPGSFNARLILETYYNGAQTIEVPISGSYLKSDIQPRDTTINLGTLKICDDVINFSHDVQNIGNIADELVLVSPVQQKGLTVQTESVFIGVTEIKSLDFEVDPAFYQNDTEESIELVYRSAECDYEVKFNVEFKIVDPELVYTPEQLQINSPWVSRTISGEITVSNNNDLDITISRVEFSEHPQLFELSNNMPLTIPANSSRDLTVNFMSPISGTFLTELRLYEENTCNDYSTVLVQAFVPEENYNTKLSIGDYKADIGEQVEISVYLHSVVDNLEADAYIWEINFNKKLFYPERVYINHNGSIIDLSYQLTPGKISGRIEGDPAKTILKTVGDILFVDGVVLAADVYLTELDLVSFEPIGYVVDFTKEDGSLEVKDYCNIPYENAGGITLLPSYEVESLTYSDNNIKVNFNSDAKQSINLELVNMLGNVVHQDKFDIQANNSSKNINVSKLPRGVYFIKFSNQRNIKYLEKLVIN